MQVGRPHQFARLAETVGHPEWVDDPRFATPPGWVEHLDVVREAVADWAGERTPVEVAEALARAGVAAAPVFEAADLVDDPHLRARHMLAEIPRTDGVDRPVLTPGQPGEVRGLRRHASHPPPPTLGQHTAEVLRTELGLDDERIDALHAAGAIGWTSRP